METARPKWRTRAWLDVGAVFLLVAILLATLSAEDETVKAAIGYATLAVIVAGLWVTIARVRKQRRTYEQELADWATERAAQAERLRIAADLHDLVSHGLGAITVRAAAARSVDVTGDSALTERELALGDIERVSRETTTELRRMLAVLREPGTAPLRPAETLADLPGILSEARAAGLSIEWEPVGLDRDDGAPVDSDAGDASGLARVSQGVQLAVCAIVREALANTLRHAGPCSARVSVRRESAAIEVRVRDSGPRGEWRAAPGAGHGLSGLRERVAALGGELHAGPRGAGFTVAARIPDQEA
ncbi:signal transduction histidine kinase [Mycolicibacterium mucogenicum 261Sha1.1M5]|nr:signal transduction histidine kinase [Mycolicibacterium mucogenicum 261Sha1.1M5]